MSNSQSGAARNQGGPHESAPDNHVAHGSAGHIVRMGTGSRTFFRAEPDRKVALDGISNHMNKFWTRRMRQKILDYAAQGGKELDELPKAALAQVVVTPPPA